MVTPFVGVWIEIISIAWIGDPSPVTPFVGVWIEIVLCETILSGLHVTPFVGVWIEIQGGKYNSGLGSSLPSWECGLKLTDEETERQQDRVTPFVGVWIEIFYKSI